MSTKIKEQLVREESPPTQFQRPPKKKLSDPTEPSLHSLNRLLSHHVSKKVEASDIHGAIRLASASDILPDFDEETFSVLQAKHPHPPQDSVIPPPPSLDNVSVQTSKEASTHFPMVLLVVLINSSHNT